MLAKRILIVLALVTLCVSLGCTPGAEPQKPTGPKSNTSSP